MFRAIVNWYREWEQEQFKVLADPAFAAQTAPGYRRHLANALARLSDIEREQLLEFSLKYRGWRLIAAIARLAVGFTLAGAVLHVVVPRLSWIAAIGVVNVMGFAIAAGLVAVWFNYRRNNCRSQNGTGMMLFVIGLALAMVGFLIKFQHLTVNEALFDTFPGGMLVGALVAALLVGIPLRLIVVMRNRQHEARTVQLRQDAERDRLARELSESQLRLLRAQIEPHFLFNTLGAVQQLAEKDAPRAAELTASLITFLRASLSEMRSDQATLRKEFALVEAYLTVMKARLGERLRFTLDLPESLAGLAVPSMIVLTLAENAIKHGIEPSLRGGEVSVRAQRRDGVVSIQVEDSGIGLGIQPGAGLGLENARNRLLLAHGAAASVTLHEAPQGVVAEIIIPSEAAGK
ncbi:histidine kinase [Massilia sp. R2A-15]|uniref:sensor histidine kinase n=1 Tax=Massilia sp. R2A-15 TaxID=3064278 RepID=UPI002733D578|nr:histidine kinase [Massilia sp. R2A-15]WLI88645.1 histidine kinase [Massilia sp. R2A-15]